ncbi:hypothetical protein L1987_00031 [Smallanthus sonchifolius]|uniref:Uncharacterized protein n=1 Tax=Smallanthus sonchifolius TaxID=185202 RepID=A0ACB9K158_9ASTR|nr:hypothetical protein L1987_00031 [Smallanthus sonchifolius]
MFPHQHLQELDASAYEEFIGHSDYMSLSRRFRSSYDIASIDLKVFEHQGVGSEEDDKDDFFDVSSPVILDEMFTHRGEWKLRSSFKDRQLHVRSSSIFSLISYSSHTKGAKYVVFGMGRFRRSYDIASIDLKVFEHQGVGSEEDDKDDFFDVSSPVILDEMFTHRGEWKLRSSFKDKQLHVRSSSIFSLISYSSHTKGAKYVVFGMGRVDPQNDDSPA